MEKSNGREIEITHEEERHYDEFGNDIGPNIDSDNDDDSEDDGIIDGLRDSRCDDSTIGWRSIRVMG